MYSVELDSAEGCTPRSLTLWYDAHLGAQLRSGMHTAELFKNSNISAKSKNRIRKYFSPFIRGLDGFESWKSGCQKSCDTLPLSSFIIQQRAIAKTAHLYINDMSEITLRMFLY